MLNCLSSIYGPGVLNDTVVPGYGITKFPVNLFTFGSLPNSTIRSFGGANQYVTYPMGYPNYMYALAKNSNIFQWNPMLLGTGLEVGNDNTNFLSQVGFNMAYETGYMLGVQQQLKRSVQAIAQAINAMEAGLNNVLKSDKLTEEQKEKLEQLLEKVEAKKAEIAEKLQGEQDCSTVAAIQKEILNLQKEVAQTAKEINKEIEDKKTEEADEAAEENSNDDDTNTSVDDKKSNNSDDLKGTKYENIDPETGKPKSLTTPAATEVDDICAEVFRYSENDKTKLETTIAKLDANNIVEVIKAWQDNKYDDKNFFTKILGALNDGDQMTLVPTILGALTDRAKELGIYDKIRPEVATINKELAKEAKWSNLWCNGQDDKKIADNLNKIYNKIVEQEKANKTGAQKILNDKKSERNNKLEEKKQQVIKEKKAEFARDMKNAMKLSETPEIASNLEVKTNNKGEFVYYSINIEGCEYHAKNYQKLVKELEKYNLDAKTCLIQQPVIA